MREHDFTLILTSDPDEEAADRIYGVCNDGTLSTISGVPQIEHAGVSQGELARQAYARGIVPPFSAKTLEEELS